MGKFCGSVMKVILPDYYHRGKQKIPFSSKEQEKVMNVLKRLNNVNSNGKISENEYDKICQRESIPDNLNGSKKVVKLESSFSLDLLHFVSH